MVNNVKNDKKVVRFNITLSQNIEKYLQKLTKQKGISKSALISIAIEKYFKDEEENNK